MDINLLEVGRICTPILAIAGVGALIIKIINRALKPIKEMEAQIGRHDKAICELLKNSITRIHRECMADGKVGRYTLESAMDMYKLYKALGGNGFVDKIIEDLQEFPIDTGVNK
jgi:hypothetical protein